jgi:hypothetical protein
MPNCWRCGGQISSYASRCTWCGRSTSVSAFLQVSALAALIFASLVVGGIVPIKSLAGLYPGNWIKESPLPARSPEATEGAGGGGKPGGTRTGYGAVEDRRAPAQPDRASSQNEESTPACASEPRLDLLAVRYREWSRADLALISCRRVREGFSEAQVIAARGRPRRRTSPEGQTSLEVWVYRDMRVVFEGDRVVSVRQQ